jgi:Ser/Thr protein kinase RdoA (MazF antagonist)
VDCRLQRSLANDVYEVVGAGGRYAFKVYRQSGAARGWSLDEVIWEQELVLALVQQGLDVPRPVRLSNGELVGRLDAPEGLRPYALTEWVEGTKPMPPWTDELYRKFGQLVARFHTLAGALRPTHPRRSTGAVDALAVATEEVLAALPDGEDRGLVRERAATAATHLTRLTQAGITRGVCHGDVTLDNVHVTAAGLVLHDFDLSGPGWLADDLTGVYSTPHWPAFKQGYRELRELSSADVEALPWLGIASRVTNLRFHLVDKVQLRGWESRSEGWVERELAGLRASVDESGHPGR